MTAGACTATDEVAAKPPADSTTQPSPTPPAIEAIDPTVSVVSRSVHAGAVIDRSQATPADEEAVAALADAVTVWLDAHLDDLQRGGAGKLADVAAVGLLDDADPAVVAGVTTGLTSPDDPVRGTDYTLEVGHDGAPRWLSARISVRTASGAGRDATFVFVPSEQGPVLVALEPRGGAA